MSTLEKLPLWGRVVTKIVKIPFYDVHMIINFKDGRTEEIEGYGLRTPPCINADMMWFMDKSYYDIVKIEYLTMRTYYEQDLIEGNPQKKICGAYGHSSDRLLPESQGAFTVSEGVS